MMFTFITTSKIDMDWRCLFLFQVGDSFTIRGYHPRLDGALDMKSGSNELQVSMGVLA